MNKTYRAKIGIARDTLKSYAKMFDYGEEELSRANIPLLSTLATFTARFKDGKFADIKVNTSEDDVWSEGVLFTPDGKTITHTPVCDGLDGVWTFETGKAVYEVEVYAKK